MSQNPSRKGGAFERECARLLSLWLTADRDRNQLIRSVSSGGWEYRNVRQVGDLAPNGPQGAAFRRVYGVECKNRESWAWRHLWTAEDGGEVIRWWRKHRDECDGAGLVPLMMLTKNYQPLLVVMPSPLIESAGPGFFNPSLRYRCRDADVTFVPWEDLARTTPEKFLVLARGRTWLDSRS